LEATTCLFITFNEADIQNANVKSDQETTEYRIKNCCPCYRHGQKLLKYD